jgi:hypothetical protein
VEGLEAVIFGLFGGKSGPNRDSDRIWKTSARKLERVAEEASAAKRVLVIAHFRSTLESVGKEIEAKGKHCRVYTDRIGASALGSPAAFATHDGIALALAHSLPTTKKSASTGEEALVLAAEHHFLPQEDDRILRFCEGLPFPSRLRFHEALDAPLLGMFAGENLARMMSQLGMAEDEAIEHAMVDRSIRSAQEKIAASHPGDKAADSPQDWMRLNLPKARTD